MQQKENQVVNIEFHGGQIEAVQQGSDIWVSVRRACEHLGIDNAGQQVKLKEKEWARVEIISTHDTAGRKQNAFMLHIDSFAGWLFTIDAGRVVEDVRPLLVAYQREAAKVLRDHFFGQPHKTASDRLRVEEEKEARLGRVQDLREAQMRAKGWELARRIAERQCRKELVEVYNVKLAETLTGEPLPSLLPAVKGTADWIFPEQIAKEEDSTPQMIGRIITELWGKGRGNLDGIREVRMGTAPGHHKMIEQCAYSPKAVEVIRARLRARLPSTDQHRAAEAFK